MKIKSLKGLLFLWGLFTASVVFGQTVTGTVTGDNLPLPGVNIVIEGTQKGTVTDFDGLYSLDGVEEGDVLVFSSIGFTTKNITYIGNPVINVNLEEDIKSLDEVVVVGYTKTTRDKLTTAVSTVNAEELSEIPAASVNEALEGRAAGVQVASNGSPGEESAVFIRGLNTFGDGRPLYVVDGVFVESLTQISPESIASVDVLKDAAASAVYGSRASNGVIIVTTKKGKAGKPKFGFSTYTGFQQVDKSKYPELLSGPDLVNFLTEVDFLTDNQNPGEEATLGNNTPARFSEPGFVPANTNFTDAVFRSSPIRNFNLDVSGGSEKATFSMNAGYFDQEGILLNTRFRRYTLNLNSDFKVNDSFKVGQTLNMGYSKSNLPFQILGLPIQAWGLRQPNYLPILDENGFFVNADRERDGTAANTVNPLLALETNRNEDIKFSTNASVFGELKLLPGLTNKTTIATSYFSQEFDQFFDSVLDSGEDQILVGNGAIPLKQIQFQRNNTVTTTFTNQLSFDKTLGSHNINASAIFERIDNKVRTLAIINSSDLPNSVTQINGDESQTTTQLFPDVLTSYVGLLGYSYGNKYFLNGSLRRDASSKFAEPVGLFPSASAAWVVSKEGFFDSVSLISNLKLRYGFGVTGNNRIQPFRDVVRLQPVISPRVGGEDQNAFAFQGLNQEALTWETSVKQNFGIDLGLFADKLKLTAEYYTNDSDDLIAFGLNAVSAGNSDVGNVGKVRSQGFEFVVDYSNNIGDFSYGVWGQISSNETEVLNINLQGDGVEELLGQPLNTVEGTSEGTISRLVPGNPLWGIYGFKTDGLYRTVEDVINSNDTENLLFVQNSTGDSLIREFNADGEPIFSKFDEFGNLVRLQDQNDVGIDEVNGVAPGDIRFQDLNGDGIIDTNDRTLIGDPTPDFTYSFNLKAGYKGFDLSAFFTGVQGVDVVNGLAIASKNFQQNAAFDASILDRFTDLNTTSNIPRYTTANPNSNVRISDRFVEDGSYLRLRSLILGYNFSNNLLSNVFKGSLEKLRFYIQGQNLFTITDYSGLDPEIRPSYNASGVIAGLGIDRGTSPAPQSVIVGLQVGF